MFNSKSDAVVGTKAVDADSESLRAFELSNGDSKDTGIPELRGMSQSEIDAIEKRVKRKVDLRLMICLWIIVFLDGLDLGALSIAKINGIQQSLNMTSSQFNTAVSVLSIGGIVMQLPSNMLLTRVRPSVYLPGAVVLLGLFSLTTGLVRNASALIVIRLILGCVEAAFIPGSLLLVSSWYTRNEIGKRGAIVFSAAQISSAFSGVIAAAVQPLNGLAGLESWRWMFILEGASTAAAAIGAFFILPDYPRNTRWLSPVERAVAESRLTQDAGEDDDDDMPMLTGLKLALKDWKLYAFAFMVFSDAVTGSVMTFFPVIVASLGGGPTKTDLLTIPPSLIGIVVGFANNFSADRFRNSSFHVMWPMVVSILGFIVIASTLSPVTRYVSTIIVISVGNAGVVQAWLQKTILRPRAKRASSVAIVGVMVNIAMLWTPFMYSDKAAPRYALAMTVNTVFAGIVILFAFGMRIFLMRENRKLESSAGAYLGGVSKESMGKPFRYVA